MSKHFLGFLQIMWHLSLSQSLCSSQVIFHFNRYGAVINGLEDAGFIRSIWTGRDNRLFMLRDEGWFALPSPPPWLWLTWPGRRFSIYVVDFLCEILVDLHLLRYQSWVSSSLGYRFGQNPIFSTSRFIWSVWAFRHSRSLTSWLPGLLDFFILFRVLIKAYTIVT